MAQVYKNQLQIFTKATDPDVNDDEAHGFQVTDIIFQTTSENFYICKSNTNGAASYLKIANLLEQNKYYTTGQAGSDSFSGKDDNACFATLTKMRNETAAQSPTAGNQYLMKLIDGATYSETVTIPQWSHLWGVGAQLDGIYIVSDESVVTMKRVSGDSISPQTVFTKNTGSQTAHIEILQDLDLNSSSILNGFQCISGNMNIELRDSYISNGSLLQDGFTGASLNCIAKGFTRTGSAGAFATHLSSGNMNIFAIDVLASATDPFYFGGSSGINTVLAGKISVNGAAFNTGSSQQTCAIVGYVRETANSTISGLNRIFAFYEHSGDPWHEYMILGAVDSGILLTADETGGDIHLKTADGNKVICEDYFTTGTDSANLPSKDGYISGVTPTGGGTILYSLPETKDGTKVLAHEVLVTDSTGNIIPKLNTLVPNSVFDTRFYTGSPALYLTVAAGSTNVASRPFKAYIKYAE